VRRDQALKDYIAAYKGFKRRKKSAKKKKGARCQN